MSTIEKLRTRRDVVNRQIEVLKAEARELSQKIREAEGPLPDRSNRPRGVGYRIAPTKKD